MWRECQLEWTVEIFLLSIVEKRQYFFFVLVWSELDTIFLIDNHAFSFEMICLSIAHVDMQQ